MLIFSNYRFSFVDQIIMQTLNYSFGHSAGASYCTFVLVSLLYQFLLLLLKYIYLYGFGVGGSVRYGLGVQVGGVVGTGQDSRFPPLLSSFIP